MIEREKLGCTDPDEIYDRIDRLMSSGFYSEEYQIALIEMAYVYVLACDELQFKGSKDALFCNTHCKYAHDYFKDIEPNSKEEDNKMTNLIDDHCNKCPVFHIRMWLENGWNVEELKGGLDDQENHTGSGSHGDGMQFSIRPDRTAEGTAGHR